MVKAFDINNFNERKQFEIRLQIALLHNTLKIKANSKNPDKYDEYIEERVEKIRALVDTTAKFTIMDKDKVIYSSEILKSS